MVLEGGITDMVVLVSKLVSDDDILPLENSITNELVLDDGLVDELALNNDSTYEMVLDKITRMLNCDELDCSTTTDMHGTG